MAVPTLVSTTSTYQALTQIFLLLTNVQVDNEVKKDNSFLKEYTTICQLFEKLPTVIFKGFKSFDLIFLNNKLTSVFLSVLVFQENNSYIYVRYFIGVGTSIHLLTNSQELYTGSCVNVYKS